MPGLSRSECLQSISISRIFPSIAPKNPMETDMTTYELIAAADAADAAKAKEARQELRETGGFYGDTVETGDGDADIRRAKARLARKFSFAGARRFAVEIADGIASVTVYWA